MDKAKGKAKEAYGAVTGDEDKKAEGQQEEKGRSPGAGDPKGADPTG